MLLALPRADGFPGLLPMGRTATVSRPAPSQTLPFPILCLHLWWGPSHPEVSIHISCLQEGLSGHTETLVPLVLLVAQQNPQQHRALST